MYIYRYGELGMPVIDTSTDVVVWWYRCMYTDTENWVCRVTWMTPREFNGVSAHVYIYTHNTSIYVQHYYVCVTVCVCVCIHTHILQHVQSSQQIPVFFVVYIYVYTHSTTMCVCVCVHVRREEGLIVRLKVDVHITCVCERHHKYRKLMYISQVYINLSTCDMYINFDMYISHWCTYVMCLSHTWCTYVMCL